jgi:peptide/nickel transport system substrate-binding protein
MELQTPDASFIANLGVGILPAAQAHGPMLTEKDQVFGCGPFVLKSATPQAIELTANNFYSFVPPPKLARVIIKIVKDENTRFAKLIAGELDMVQNLISRDKLTIIGRDHPELTILRRPGLNTVYLGFNMRTPALSNKLVRQAITHAIDKDKIIHYVLKDMAVPADTLLPTADPFHAADLPVLNYDPRRASDLLDQAGFKPDSNGQRFTLSYKTTTDQTRVVVAKAIAAELRRVGIAVHIETLEWGRFKADVDHGRVEMWGLSWVGFKDPDIYRFAFSTTGFPPDGGNRGWFSSTAVDKLLEAGAEQTDTSKRSAIYADAQRLLAGEAPYVFLWHEDVFAVVGRHVEGFEVYADGRLHSLTNTFKN